MSLFESSPRLSSPKPKDAIPLLNFETLRTVASYNDWQGYALKLEKSVQVLKESKRAILLDTDTQQGKYVKLVQTNKKLVKTNKDLQAALKRSMSKISDIKNGKKYKSKKKHFQMSEARKSVCTYNQNWDGLSQDGKSEYCASQVPEDISVTNASEISDKINDIEIEPSLVSIQDGSSSENSDYMNTLFQASRGKSKSMKKVKGRREVF